MSEFFLKLYLNLYFGHVFRDGRANTKNSKKKKTGI